jgi:hypothetical protein
MMMKKTRERHTQTEDRKRFPEDSEVTMIVETDRLLHAFLPQTSGLKMAGQMRKEREREREKRKSGGNLELESDDAL